MATSLACPVLDHLKQADLCAEEFGGLGDKIYLFNPADLTAPPTIDGTLPGFVALTFKEGKGCYEVDCDVDTNKIEFELQKERGGYKRTLTIGIDRADSATSILMRAVGNLNLGAIVPDGDKFQILYNPNRKLKKTIKGDTGAKPEDKRNTTITLESQMDLFPIMYVPGPIKVYAAPVTP